MFLLLCFVSVVTAEFTPHFRAFLHQNYGIEMAQELEKTDLGVNASFGGKISDDDELKNQAVVLVHGLTQKANRFKALVKHFMSKGYSKSEIYATTWGDGGQTIFTYADMKCSFVKQIRNLIIAVRQYTGTKVDIIAYSMGSPLARKAILGGNCVDTREILGPPLTELIDTFLSVAGTNFGSILCLVPIPFGICNKRTGLHCESTFIKDINSQKNYEGTFIFSTFSAADELSGYRVCGRLTSPIRGGTGYIRHISYNHSEVLDKNHELHRNFVLHHKP